MLVTHNTIQLAAVYLAQGRGQQCDQALEHALATDFSIREMPAYHLLRARRAAAANRFDEAMRIVDAALALPVWNKIKISFRLRHT